MTTKKSTSLLLAGIACILLLCLLIPLSRKMYEQTVYREKNNTSTGRTDLYFDSLLVWQSGNTNHFLHLINAAEYDPHLRDAVKRELKKGEGCEVQCLINRSIDHWIITEASHSRNYEWPDKEIDSDDWRLLARICTNRLEHPCSTGENSIDSKIIEILSRTQCEKASLQSQLDDLRVLHNRIIQHEKQN